MIAPHLDAQLRTVTPEKYSMTIDKSVVLLFDDVLRAVVGYSVTTQSAVVAALVKHWHAQLIV